MCPSTTAKKADPAIMIVHSVYTMLDRAGLLTSIVFVLPNFNDIGQLLSIETKHVASSTKLDPEHPDVSSQ
jgi:hypothetical protein